MIDSEDENICSLESQLPPDTLESLKGKIMKGETLGMGLSNLLYSNFFAKAGKGLNNAEWVVFFAKGRPNDDNDDPTFVKAFNLNWGFKENIKEKKKPKKQAEEVKDPKKKDDHPEKKDKDKDDKENGDEQQWAVQ